MIYLLHGEETYRMNIRKNELIQAKDVTKENLTIFDYETPQPFAPVINACNTLSLFAEHRIILVRNAFFLNPKGKSAAKGKDKEDIAYLLEQYLTHPNPDTDLIFYCPGFKIDQRKKESKVLKSFDGKSVRILSFDNPSPYELDRILDQELAKNKIHLSRDARDEFRLRINDSATELYKGMEKLCLYQNKQLDLNDIKHLISINPDINIWKFQDAFLARNAKETIRNVKEMQEISNMTPQSIIPLLSFRLKQVFMVVRCKELGMSFQEIKAKTKRYYPDKDYQSAHGRSSHELLEMIYELALLDQGMKGGTIDPQEGLDYFLLKHLRPYGLSTR